MKERRICMIDSREREDYVFFGIRQIQYHTRVVDQYMGFKLTEDGMWILCIIYFSMAGAQKREILRQKERV